jgi:hypothetical protein
MEPWFERGHVVVLVPSSRTCRVNPYSGQAHDMARSFCGICRLPQDACDSKKLVTSHAHIASKLSCVQQRTGRLPHRRLHSFTYIWKRDFHRLRCNGWSSVHSFLSWPMRNLGIPQLIARLGKLSPVVRIYTNSIRLHVLCLAWLRIRNTWSTLWLTPSLLLAGRR